MGSSDAANRGNLSDVCVFLYVGGICRRYMVFVNEQTHKDLQGIYQIHNVLNDKVYIGQTKESFQRRFWHHRWKLRADSHDNQYLQDAWNECGEDSFVFEVLEVICDSSLLDDAETQYIKSSKSNGKSYNILDGGGGRPGIPMSANAKRLVGEKNRIHMTGKKLSEETRARMRQSSRGSEVARYRVSTKINVEIAATIKSMLISGMAASKVSKQLSLPYNIVNSILSESAWKDVYVDGWEEFQNARNKTYRLTYQDAEDIRQAHKNGESKKSIAERYNKERHTIYDIIRGKTFA